MKNSEHKRRFSKILLSIPINEIIEDEDPKIVSSFLIAKEQAFIIG